ncbi:FecR family protein [Chitinophaga sp. GCM10012297]|uniref:FecR domain-containing protein n=1 Tax=Chitinophaga chungangae TaxID=2821488 RepID=A0ABS3YGT6_9BACT|nr:FecR family protein [Chitinophaga chungangae]MBO9153503.1 FecR domain-containing protein [Chitinophaga chungangae]
MNEIPKVISDLIARHLNDELNDQERQELDKWVQQSEDHQRFFRQFTDEASLASALKEYETSRDIVYNKIKEAVSFNGQAGKKIVNIRRLRMRRFAAVAASLLALAGAFVWWNLLENNAGVPGTAVTQNTGNGRPASPGAVLKLADGKEIVLDDAVDGAVAKQGNTRITKQGGQLSYAGNNSGSQVLYNTLSTPKGKIYQLLLPDSSKVWLNAASSIRFPTAFTGGERSVEVTGEVYFEVKQNAEMPFHVAVSQRAAIDVLGTSFNVNAYGNEEALRATVLTGSVRVRMAEQEDGKQGVVLKPGQQAQLKQLEVVQSITVVHNANIKNVMGWKDGYFSLDDLTLEELMREVERWYDVEVTYEKGIPAKAFFGKVSRNLSLPDFMEGLKDWGVRFRLEGRKIIITGVQ